MPYKCEFKPRTRNIKRRHSLSLPLNKVLQAYYQSISDTPALKGAKTKIFVRYHQTQWSVERGLSINQSMRSGTSTSTALVLVPETERFLVSGLRQKIDLDQMECILIVILSFL